MDSLPIQKLFNYHDNGVLKNISYLFMDLGFDERIMD